MEELFTLAYNNRTVDATDDTTVIIVYNAAKFLMHNEYCLHLTRCSKFMAKNLSIILST